MVSNNEINIVWYHMVTMFTMVDGNLDKQAMVLFYKEEQYSVKSESNHLHS